MTTFQYRIFGRESVSYSVTNWQESFDLIHGWSGFAEVKRIIIQDRQRIFRLMFTKFQRLVPISQCSSVRFGKRVCGCLETNNGDSRPQSKQFGDALGNKMWHQNMISPILQTSIWPFTLQKENCGHVFIATWFRLAHRVFWCILRLKRNPQSTRAFSDLCLRSEFRTSYQPRLELLNRISQMQVGRCSDQCWKR